MAPTTFTLTPIGVMQTPYSEKYRTPRQPGTLEAPPEGVITLFPGSNFEQALEDLAGFDRVWILSWFHRNEGWTPKVLPPRAGSERKGLFATRSPHRPNPIGLSLCRLLGVEGRTIRVEDPDLLDGTPILDIKPYLPYAEAFPDAAAGWIDALPPEEERYEVAVDPFASLQLDWLRSEHGIDLLESALPVLASHPLPHPSRRTKELSPGEFVLAVKSWRVYYAVHDRAVKLRRIASGYGADAIAAGPAGELHDHAAHEAFHRLWPPIELPTT